MIRIHTAASACALTLVAFGLATPPGLAQIPVRPTVPEAVGVNIHFTDPRPGEMEMLASTGVRWIRMDLIWGNTERERGKYDFSAYDRLMAALDAHRIRALLILNGRNRLYDQGQFPNTDEGRQACAQWAGAAVRHFRGRGILWEMWNEPNVKRKTSPTAEVYAKLAIAVGEAVRKAAPKEPYVGPATSLIDMPFLETCFRAGLLRYWDGVTVHPYRFNDPETVIPEYEQLRALMAKHSPPRRTVPVLQGEWGWASVYRKDILLGWAQMREGMNDELQGELLARQWLTNFACGIPLSIWYDWHDDGPSPTDPEAHCGIVLYPYQKDQKPVYTPKPAYWAARALTTVFQGYRFDQALPLGQPGDYVLAFRAGRRVRYAAWAAGDSRRTVRIPVKEGPCSVVSHKGEERGKLPVTGGEVSLPLQNTPQYLVCGKDQASPAIKH